MGRSASSCAPADGARARSPLRRASLAPRAAGASAACVWLLLTSGPGGAAEAPAPPRTSIHSRAAIAFDIPALPLVRSAEIFGSQSGLQIVYAMPEMTARGTRPVSGTLAIRDALDRMLEGTGLCWSAIGNYTVVITPAGIGARDDPSPRVARRAESAPPLDAVLVSGQHAGAGETSSLGFRRPLIDTPRNVSVLDSRTLERLGIAANDLSVIIPASHTTTRYGVSGTVDVRNIPADLYFRGMKRLTPRGHVRKVTAALDNVEVVGGPASPLHGMGKLGGYTNVVPKTGRALEGGYLQETSGYAQLVTGSYGKLDLSFGVGGPTELGGRHGGYYVHGYAEDSGAYSHDVTVQQKLLQAGLSIDDFIGGLRLETGFFVQSSRTAGAMVARLTQQLVDDGTYVRGTPLVDLDLDGSGAISYLEMHAGSPAGGTLSALNQPLSQAFEWPRDAAGNPLPLAAFPHEAGIPRSLLDFLTAHPEADPTGLLRAQGAGGPVPVSGHVPLGMALDPRTVGIDRLDLRRAAAYEAHIDADFLTAYLDLVDDDDPRLTVRNQLFFDGTRHTKLSFQPYSQDQRAYVVEEKLTVGSRFDDRLPEGLRAQALVSLNLRHTRSWGRSSGVGDFANSRTDAMGSTWSQFRAGMTPNSTFMTPLVEDDVSQGGYPWARRFDTAYTERGLGGMLDVDIGPYVNLVGGLRFDHSSARNVDRAGRFDPDDGTSAEPGQVLTADDRARADRGAFSWSASLSVRAPGGWRPYLTYSRASLMLDEDDNSLRNAVIQGGHVGRGELREVGIKAGLLEGRLAFSAAAFRQRRMDVSASTEQALLDTYTTATLSRGWNASLQWRPRKGISASGYASVLSTYYQPNLGGPQLVDAATLGFRDIHDADGNVVYPANALLYGGKAWLLLPDGMKDYAKMRGNPDVMLGATLGADITRGFGVTAGFNYLARTCSGRLCTVVLPSATPLRAGVYWQRGAWEAQFDAMNLLDQKTYRARVDDSLGNVVVRALPDRSFYLTLRRNFSL